MEHAELTPGRSDQSVDAELVRRSIAGDQAAWSDLVERYQRLVYSIPRRYGLSNDLCEDVFQGVFVSLIKNISLVRDTGSLPRWLMTTAHRESWRVANAAQRSQLRGKNLPERATPESPPESDLVRWERQHAVHHALDRLGGRCEQLLRAIFLDPSRPSYAEISERLGVPVGSIGPVRARCLAKLSEFLTAL